MRGTPLMLQILFVYYALPIITDGAVQMDDAAAAVLTFVLNYAAYLCGIFRGGIQSISRGQYEGQRFLVLPMPKRCVRSSCHKCLNAYCLRLRMRQLTC